MVSVVAFIEAMAMTVPTLPVVLTLVISLPTPTNPTLPVALIPVIALPTPTVPTLPVELTPVSDTPTPTIPIEPVAETPVSAVCWPPQVLLPHVPSPHAVDMAFYAKRNNPVVASLVGIVNVNVPAVTVCAVKVNTATAFLPEFVLLYKSMASKEVDKVTEL